MSYLRYSWALSYVEGDSDDYIFNHAGGFIEDYGGISDTGLVELLCRAIDEYYEDDKLMQEYIKNKLAERLKVKLREKPLTTEELFKDMDEKIEKMNKEREANKK